MYNYEILPSLQKIVQKLSKKDKVLYEQVLKKIQEVIHSREVEHYKNLRHDLSDKKRVHVGLSWCFDLLPQRIKLSLLILTIMIRFMGDMSKIYHRSI